MLKNAVTLRDVAEGASVHPSTASRALNVATRDLVNPDTVRRILEVAEQLGYQPNSLARGLKTNRTFSVGMLIPDLTNPLFPPIVRGIEDALVEEGYTLVLANTDNDADKERTLVEVMGRRRVDGLILATARRDYPLLDDVLASRMPVVLINRTADDPPVPSVTGDDHAGIGMAVRHLVSLGHTRIAHVAGPQSVTTGLTRYQSFVSWMRSAGLETDPELVVFAEWFQEEPGARACGKLLERGADFSAIVAANDLIALGCYDVLRARAIDIPADISVIGYNDIPFCDKFQPPLTTIGIPHYHIGVKAAELMLESMAQPQTAPVAIRLTPSLVERASTTRPGSRL